MLSYRHAFHAGNHADVLKHLGEVLILDYLQLKRDKPLCYIDTHSGPGAYALRDAFAQKNAEYDSGIGRLWNTPDLPAPVARYVEVVKGFNDGGELVRYPGSPAIARALLGDQDRLQLFELHPDDFRRLQQWGQGDRHLRAQQLDGFAQLNALLPPREKRALVLMDPPFEVKQDYQRVVQSIEQALKRFATGVYMIWYPLLARPEISAMLGKLKQLTPRHLHAELRVKSRDAGGMFGSGIFVINPPWKLHEQLEQSLPYLQQALAQDDKAGFVLETRGLD